MDPPLADVCGRRPEALRRFTLASVVACSRRAWCIEWHPKRVEFRFEAPPHADSHARLFGCPVRYGQETNRLVIDRATWSQDLPSSNPGLVELLEQHARLLAHQISSPPDDFLTSVRDRICGAIHRGDCSLETVASALGTSSRSLQRRLNERGTTFAELADLVRCDLARFHLRERSSAIAEIGHLLGFSEQSGFQRAFKRWTGETPKQFRQRAMVAGGASPRRSG